MAGSASEMRTNVPRAPGSSEAMATEGVSSITSSRGGMGAPGGAAGGDGFAGGVAGGVAELGRDEVLELLREDVLEHLGLRVDAVPRHAEALGQVELEQAVVADDLERALGPAGGEPDALVGLVGDELQLAELAHHARRRGRRDPEALGERGGRDGARAVGRERVDRLGVVLDRRGDGRVAHWHDGDYGMPKL